MPASESDQSGQISLEVSKILQETGIEGLTLARKIMLEEKIESLELHEAINYFMASWKDVFHPALVSLACESVGGKTDQNVIKAGSGLVLLAGGADIHDDIIDNSSIKYGKETVFGKYGKDIAILAGDALIVKGFATLYEACLQLNVNQSKAIFDVTLNAFFGISSAEAHESSLKKASNMAPEQYLDMIKLKASVGEATAIIGAIFGMGSSVDAAILASFGRTFSILMTLKDEFIDVYEIEEMKNRLNSEWLPLPILYAMKNELVAAKLRKIIKPDLSEQALEKILQILAQSKEVDELIQWMKETVNQEIIKIEKLQNNVNIFTLMLKAGIEDL
jgi:geranylgeranyl pyrophosphate synthase